MTDSDDLYSDDYTETVLILTIVLAATACFSFLTWVVLHKSLPWLSSYRRGQKRPLPSGGADRGGDDNISRDDLQSEGVAPRARSPQPPSSPLFDGDQYDRDAVRLDKVVVDSPDGARGGGRPANLYRDRLPSGRLPDWHSTNGSADDESSGAECWDGPALDRPSSRRLSSRRLHSRRGDVGTGVTTNSAGDQRALKEAGSAATAHEPHRRRREPFWPLGGDALLAGRSLTHYRNTTGGRSLGACFSDESPSSKRNDPATGLSKEQRKSAGFQPRARVATGHADVERRSSGAVRKRWAAVSGERARRSV